MDLSKAFDVIPHGLLVAKLSAYGFDANWLNLIYDYLKDRHQRVKVSQARSNWTRISKGVPQGSVLGPTLFNVFLNDMLFHVDYDIYNYADDNTISYVSPSCSDLIMNIEKCGDMITEWFADNGLQANPDKYQAIVFGGKNDLPNKFSIKGSDVNCMETVKLLGIEIDNKLLFSKHVSSLCAKASRQINAVMRLRNVLDIAVKEQIFSAFVKSTFSYCPVVWMFCGQNDVTKLDKLQHRALRFVYNDFDAPYHELLSRSNTMSVSNYLKYVLSIEMYKCVNNQSPSYLCELFERKMYNYNMRDNSKLVQKKFKTVSHGFKSFGYYGAKTWNDLSNDVKCLSLNEFKSKLKDSLMK